MVLGIDPGLASTGWAVVDSGNRLVSCGCFKTKRDEGFAVRLAKIYNQIDKLCRNYKIRELAIESIFFAKNVKTAIIVAQAMGAIKAAAQNLKVAVFEYTPLQIKIAITGYGRADKEQVIKMVGESLKGKNIIENNHAADAAAAALTHIFTNKTGGL
jgi:crossover junction endodeoxyribonuclease RuvC